MATGAFAAIVGIGCLVAPGTASAGSGKLATPSGERVVRVSASSFTVVAKAAANARRYRLFASTTKSDLYETNISHAQESVTSPTPQMSLHGLAYTTAPYYYRVEVTNGPHHRFSPTIHAVGLRPAAPTKLRTASRATGSFLTWNAKASAGFSVTRASNPAMTRNVQTYKVLGATHQFTPPGLARDHTYYFQVRALNDTTHSTPSAPVAVSTRSKEQPISVMTYNILDLTADGKPEGDGVVAPWSQRKPAVAALIKGANPDVVAIQEGAPWVGPPRGLREVDTLRSALGGEYALSHTELATNKPHFKRTSDYILYKTSAYKAIGHSWHWSVGDDHWAVYQILENRKTHAKFLFVCTHLWVGNGAAADKKRENETKVLLRHGSTYAASHHVPVIYAGDFNTDHTPAHAFDGPGIVMRAAHIADAYNAAQSRTLPKFNSSNQYYRRPPRAGDRIDYVFAPPGVAVRTWRVVIDMSHRQFVGVIPSDHNPVLVTLDFPY